MRDLLVLMHIISQLRPGADLSRVTLPTFILEPRSMLERITKCVRWHMHSVQRDRQRTDGLSLQFHGSPGDAVTDDQNRRPRGTLHLCCQILPERVAHQTAVWP